MSDCVCVCAYQRNEDHKIPFEQYLQVQHSTVELGFETSSILSNKYRKKVVIVFGTVNSNYVEQTNLMRKSCAASCTLCVHWMFEKEE